MDSSDPRAQPPQPQQQRQAHPTQTNPQQPLPPQQQQPQQQQALQHPQQQQQLHQPQNIHPPQHAQQNQSAGYAPQQQQQHHAYAPQMQFPPYQPPQYRHAYAPQNYSHPHMAHQPHYPPYPYAGHVPYQTPTWTPPASTISNAPMSTPPAQGVPVTHKPTVPLVPRVKKGIPIVDPKTRQVVINPTDMQATNKSQNDTNNKAKPATTIAPASNATTTSTTAKPASTVAATVATTKTTTTQQSIASTTPTPTATKNSASPAKANSAANSNKAAPAAADRNNTSSPPSVSNILLQKVSEDSDSSKRPAAAAPVSTASPTKPAPKEVPVAPPKVEQPAVATKKQAAATVPVRTVEPAATVTTTPPKAEADVKAETDGKKDVVDDINKEVVIDDKKDDIQNDKDREDDSTKDVVEAEGEMTLHYEPGQYNPTSNRSGKKKYSREFMVEVCEKICKLNIFNEGANDNNLSNSYSQLDTKIDMFAPKYQQQQNFSSANRMNDPMRRQNPNNYMGRSSAGQERQRKVIAPSSSLTNEVELKTVSNPWRPGMDKKEDAPLDAVEVEALKKKFRSILNKLTPNNFDNLASAVTDLHIDTEQKLGEVIDIVFAKALAEPGYCVLYGRMCSHLKKITAGTANFGNTLLRRCQVQFNQDIYSGLNVDERKKKIEDEENADIKKQLGEELYEEMYRSRMRGLGLIKFIGELYKIEMLNDQIMFDCIQRLLGDTSSEESLECLCDLLSTIGEKLDRSSQKKAKEEKKSQKNAPKPNAYASGGKSAASVVASNAPPKAPEPMTLDPIFDQLHKIRKNQELPLSLRIRFKLLDVCELREKENWQSKNTKDNNPKKIEEIREAHKEKLESERQKQAMGGRRSQEGRRLGHAGGSSNQISSMGNDSGARGGMHGSASSQAIRDQSFGDRTPNYQDIHKRAEQYQQDVEQTKKFLTGIKPIDRTSKPESESLRPMVLRPANFLRPSLTPTNANSNNNSSSNSAANTNSANAAAGGSQ